MEGLELANIIGLRCTECGERFPQKPIAICNYCFAPLEVEYDYEQIKEELSKEILKERKETLWRYKELLPIENEENIVSLNEGYTPLKKCDRLSEKLGLNNLFLKDDTVNPTYSFKDRPASVAISKASEFGFKAVGCASTGNLAAATAAYSAKVGLDCYILVPCGLELSKIGQALIYGAKIISVKGTYDDANRLAVEVADRGTWALVNVNIRSYYVEGSKTLAFEVCEQLEWRTPDVVFIPMASGALLCAFWRGLKELERLGFVEEVKTRLVGVQPYGCSPIVTAFKAGRDEIIPVEKPETLVKSLAIGYPASGYHALQTIRESGGKAEAVTDEEVILSEKLLASTEGVYSEPASATTIAALKGISESGEIDKDETVVCLITGNGLKAPDIPLMVSKNIYEIEPNLKAFSQVILH